MPVDVAEGGLQGHPALLFVFVPVADRRAGLDRSEPVRRAGLEQHRLDQRRLSRPAVTDDGDVANLPGLDRHEALPPRQGPAVAGILNYDSNPARAVVPERRALRRRIALVWSWETRDSVTPSTSPISRRVSSS